MAERPYKRLLICERVIVNLVDGSAIEGVLTDQDGPLLVLQDATLHSPGGGDGRPMDGRVVVERDRVLFVQAPRG